MSDSSQGSTLSVGTVPSPWLTVTQAASYLQMRESEMRKKVKSGEIVSYLRGKRTVFVNTNDLDAWMRSLPSGAAPIAVAAKKP